MSTTYHLACVDCLQELWIGQRGSANRYPALYGGDPYQAGLLLFFITHQCHHLTFGTDDEIEGACRNGKPIEFQSSFVDPDLLAEILSRFDLSTEQLDATIAI